MKKAAALFVVGIVGSVSFGINAAHANGMKPGQWEVSTQMSGANLPSMPAISDSQRKQMEAMGVKLPPAGGNIGVTTKICITPEQAKQGVPPSIGKDQEKCERTDLKVSGNTTSWKMVCNGKHKATGTGTVTFDSPEHFSGESTITMLEPPPGAPATMNSKFSGKFLSADCPAAK